MSDEPLRIALVAEGVTDLVIVEASLKAVLEGRPFILTLLQPEATKPELGGGWCGVFKWCRDFAERGQGSIEQDPTLSRFDLFVLHLDADVAGMKYADGGAALEEAARGLLPLPCEAPCPPPEATVSMLRPRLFDWLGVKELGPRTALCMPSKAIDAWLAAATLPDSHKLLVGLECNGNLSAQLENLPKEHKIRKTILAYRARASELTTAWARVVTLCKQANLFATEVRDALAARKAEAVAENVVEPSVAPAAPDAEAASESVELTVAASEVPSESESVPTSVALEAEKPPVSESAQLPVSPSAPDAELVTPAAREPSQS